MRVKILGIILTPLAVWPYAQFRNGVLKFQRAGEPASAPPSQCAACDTLTLGQSARIFKSQPQQLPLSTEKHNKKLEKSQDIWRLNIRPTQGIAHSPQAEIEIKLNNFSDLYKPMSAAGSTWAEFQKMEHPKVFSNKKYKKTMQDRFGCAKKHPRIDTVSRTLADSSS